MLFHSPVVFFFPLPGPCGSHDWVAVVHNHTMYGWIDAVSTLTPRPTQTAKFDGLTGKQVVRLVFRRLEVDEGPQNIKPPPPPPRPSGPAMAPEPETLHDHPPSRQRTRRDIAPETIDR